MIEYGPRAVAALKKSLDREIARRVFAKLEAAALCDDPTVMAKPMTGNLKGLWSYRIGGGYRVIADIQPDRLVILAIDVGPRRDIYEN